MIQHHLYHYSITIKTRDEVVLQCLRAIAGYAQTFGNKRIVRGGTKKVDWRRNNYQVTFHFSVPRYGQMFENEAHRILPTTLWRAVRINDYDLASPQN